MSNSVLFIFNHIKFEKLKKIQKISALLDDIDKELNNYIMRCREWYGWHFPELSKIVTDNLVYAKVVQALGER